MSADASRSDRRRLIALLERLVVALEVRAEVAVGDRLERPVAPETITVRLLGIQHLGRWIYLPGRPALHGPRTQAEPTIAATAGRLVGIRPGKPGAHNDTAHRVLVLLQGSATAELPVSVVERVDVAPREW